MKEKPDLRVLAGFIRNKIKAGQPASIMHKGVEIIITRAPFDRLLVATSAGEAIIIEAHQPISFHTFTRKGFRLQRASFLANTFQVLSDTIDMRRERAKHGETTKVLGGRKPPQARRSRNGYPQTGT